MNENARALFKTFEQFKKLNICSLMPELSASENMTLHAIERVNRECALKNEKAKVSMLACDIHANPAQVSRTLKMLEEKDLIERSVSKKDRRITYVELTQKGRSYHEKTSKVMNEFTDAVFNQLDENDLVRLTDFMNNMYEIAVIEIEKRRVSLKSGKMKQVGIIKTSKHDEENKKTKHRKDF